MTTKRNILTLVAAMLTLAATTVNAANVLYAEVSGATMTLKCAATLPSGATKYDGTNSWGSSIRSSITNVTIHESCKNYDGTSLAGLFYSFSKLTTITGLENLKTAAVTDMRSMFNNCSALTTLDLSSFNTAAVTNMSSMFSGCNALTTLDLSSFNTAAVTFMSYMFNKCEALTSLTLSSSFNTAAVTDMNRMFSYCKALTTLDLSSFNTAAVTNMDQMFSYCDKLASLDLSSFNTAAVTDMNSMFCESKELTSITFSPSFNTSSVTQMSNMFSGCRALTSLDLSMFDTSNVTGMANLFNSCAALTTLDLSTFNTSNVMNMHQMFIKCSNLKTIIVDDTKWSTTSVTNSTNMFNSCSALIGEDGSTVGTTVDVTYAHTNAGGYLTRKTASVTPNATAIDGGHWATYYKSAVNRKVEGTGTTVYAATRAGSQLTLVEVTDGIIKAGQGVILKSATDGAITLTTVATAADDTKYAGNALSGADKPTSQTAGKTYYVLSYENEKLGFYKYAASQQLGAHKAYIEVTEGSLAPAMLDLNLGNSTTDSGATTVSPTKLTPAADADAAYYTLDGRRLDARPTRKGIYITSGKTFIIK